MPLGAAAAWWDRTRSGEIAPAALQWIVAFGGGALMCAVALVLVPEGLHLVPAPWSIAIFAMGGIVFYLLDRFVEKGAGKGGMLLAMLLDYLPEAMALGAMLATFPETALLLAVMIFLQNLPEGFASFAEICTEPEKSGRFLLLFVLLAATGPLAAWLGLSVLSDQPIILGSVMLFAGAGVLYLVFQDVAPKAHVEGHWSPALGAVAGFTLGLLGHVLAG